MKLRDRLARRRHRLTADLRDQVVTLTTERDQLRRNLVDARADAAEMRELLRVHIWLGPGPCPICRTQHPSGGGR